MPTRDLRTDIQVDGEHIAGTFVTPKPQTPGVLFLHGWGGSKEQYLSRAREIATLGCVCLTVDLRGHAGTLPLQQKVSRENNLRDALAAYDALAGYHGVDQNAIAVVGSSYGGYLASILTTMRPVKWLALRVPALYMDTGWDLPKTQLHTTQDLDAYRKSLVPAAENRALRACAAFEGDVLIVESERDHVVPHAVISNYLDACIRARSLTYRVIKGADHGLSDEAWQRSYTTLLVSWMTEMVFGAREIEATQVPILQKATVPEAPPQPG